MQQTWTRRLNTQLRGICLKTEQLNEVWDQLWFAHNDWPSTTNIQLNENKEIERKPNKKNKRIASIHTLTAAHTNTHMKYYAYTQRDTANEIEVYGFAQLIATTLVLLRRVQISVSRIIEAHRRQTFYKTHKENKMTI